MYEKSFVKGFNKANPTTPFNKLSWEDKALAFLTIGRGLPEELVQPLIDANKIKIETYFIDGFYQEAVMFLYENGDWNGRIIDPKGKRKSHSETGSSISATFFLTKPLSDYDFSKDTRIAESPIKALALEALGIQAIGLSSAIHLNDPSKPQLADLKKLGFTKLSGAFDNDKGGAGQGALKALDSALKSTEQSLGITAGTHIQPFISGKDWDDLLKDGKEWADIQQKCEDSASLALATTAQDWLNRSVEIQNREEASGRTYSIPAVFEFRGKTYTWKFTKIGNDKVPEKSELGEFTAKIARFTRKETEDGEIADFNPVLEVINTAGSKPERFEIPIAGSEISTSDGLKKILQAKAKAVVLEKTIPPSFIQHLYRKHDEVPVHTEWSKFGYHKKTGAFIFPEFTVKEDGSFSFSQNGSVEIRPNEMYQSFKEDDRLRISEAHQPTTSDAEKLLEFAKIAHAAYGNNSIIFIAWQAMVACRDVIQAEGIGTPFTSAVGKPSTGKSKFLEWHQRLIGLKQEGLTYGGSTPKGRERSLAQRSGLPISFKEVNNGKWNDSEWLHIIDGGNTGAKGKFSNDTQTVSYSIECLPVFSGNFLPQMGMAMVSRMIPLEFTNERQAETEYDWSNLQDFITTAGNAEQSCLEFFREIQKIKKPGIWKPVFQTIKNELEQLAGSSAKKLDGYARVIQNYSLIYTFGKLIFDNIGLKVEENGELKSVEGRLKSEVVVLMRRTFEKLGSGSDLVIGLVDLLNGLGCLEPENYETTYDETDMLVSQQVRGERILKNSVRAEGDFLYISKDNLIRGLLTMGHGYLVDPKNGKQQLIDALKEHPAYMKQDKQRLKKSAKGSAHIMLFNFAKLTGQESVE
jgi:hypothetical protein